jgi:hypothetical protein
VSEPITSVAAVAEALKGATITDVEIEGEPADPGDLAGYIVIHAGGVRIYADSPTAYGEAV